MSRYRSGGARASTISSARKRPATTAEPGVPSARAALLAAGILALAPFAACDGGAPEQPTQSFEECGLPSPEPDFDSAVVPSGFVPADAQITNAQQERGGFVAAINVRASVTEAFDAYKDALVDEGFQLTGEDNEGFEAELYFRQGRRKLGAIQIRSSRCEDQVVVFVQIVDRRFLG